MQSDWHIFVCAVLSEISATKYNRQFQIDSFGKDSILFKICRVYQKTFVILFKVKKVTVAHNYFSDGLHIDLDNKSQA